MRALVSRRRLNGLVEHQCGRELAARVPKPEENNIRPSAEPPLKQKLIFGLPAFTKGQMIAMSTILTGEASLLWVFDPTMAGLRHAGIALTVFVITALVMWLGLGSIAVAATKEPKRVKGSFKATQTVNGIQLEIRTPQGTQQILVPNGATICEVDIDLPAE